jgi:disulfide oxidoreductase YuzD
MAQKQLKTNASIIHKNMIHQLMFPYITSNDILIFNGNQLKIKDIFMLDCCYSLDVDKGVYIAP